MQAAAPTALLGKDSKVGKTSTRHGEQARAKTAFQAILGAKAAATPKGDPASAVRNALLKALAGTSAADKTHVDGLKSAPGNFGRLTAKIHAGEQLLNLKATAAKAILEMDSDAGEDGKNLKKKAAPRHADGLHAGVAPTAVNLGFKSLQKADQNRAEAPRLAVQENVAPVSHAAARKAPEIRVHVVDARKKRDAAPAEDQSAAVKVQKIGTPDRDASQAPIIARDGGAPDATIHETRRQSPPPTAPFTGGLERFREMAGSELTRAAGIILRDGGGEIKLTLKPESLGSVRIRMNLVDNAIEGRIIVDNTAVKHVFEGSLDSLMRALTAEGFQTASLSVSVGGQGADNGRPDREPMPHVRRVNVPEGAAGFDWNMPGVESMSLGDLLVNLFV